MSSKTYLRVAGANDREAGRRSLRILIADDDKDTVKTLATILRQEGHEVSIALRGDEVLELDRLLRSDAMILDVNMPGMSGYAVAREVRARRAPLGPLLIAISGVWTTAADRLTGEKIGFDHYLLKPCDPKQILALIEPLCAGSSAEDAA